jgi:hypothetical protein
MAQLRAMRRRKKNPSKHGHAPSARALGAKSALVRHGRHKNPGISSAIAYNLAHQPGRVANGKRRRKALGRLRLGKAARRSNPGFNLKSSLIQSAVLVAGVFAASQVVPMIEKFIQESTGLEPKAQGYVKILGAAGTVVLGDFLADKFGSKLGFDIRPATYAIATYMAVNGLRGADLIDGSVALSGPVVPMTGTMGLILPPNPTNPMTGTMGLILPSEPTNPMTGSIMTEFPSPVIAPHNVMQGGDDCDYGGYDAHGGMSGYSAGSLITTPSMV